MRDLVEGNRGARFAALITLIGTFVSAQVLFPVDPSPQGALRESGLCLSAAILLIPILRLLSGSPSATNAETFVAIGFLLWLLFDLIQGSYVLNEAQPDSLRKALWAIGLFAAAMWMGVTWRAWRLPNWVVQGVSTPIDANTIAYAVPICFLLGMFNFMYSVDFDIPLMFSYLGEQRWAMPWGRNQLGGWESFRDQAPYFGYVLPCLAAVLITRRGLTAFESMFAIGASVIMLLFLSTGGGRRVVAVPVGAALIVWLQLNPGLRFRNIVVVIVSVISLAWTAQFMLNIRTYGYAEYLQRGTEYDYLHVDDNFLRLAQCIEIIPARRDFVTYRQVYFTLIRPIPRVFWPGKPVSAGFDLPTEVGMKNVSLSTSIIGEWYISYGFIAVILGGWIYGRFATMANTLRAIGTQRGNAIVYALAVMVLLAGMRSMQDLMLMSYALVAWWAVSKYTAPRLNPAFAR